MHLKHLVELVSWFQASCRRSPVCWVPSVGTGLLLPKRAERASRQSTSIKVKFLALSLSNEQDNSQQPIPSNLYRPSTCRLRVQKKHCLPPVHKAGRITVTRFRLINTAPPAIDDKPGWPSARLKKDPHQNEISGSESLSVIAIID